MRFAYIDEAGTASNEPVTVVAGIVVDSDAQRTGAESAVASLQGFVPEPLRGDFWFHATEIWNNKRYKDGWTFVERKRLLCEVMALPRRMKIPIVLGMVRRNAVSVGLTRMPVRREQFEHIMAFGSCIEQADGYVREFGKPDEALTVIAEDVPEMRSWLKKAVAVAKRAGGRMVPPEHQEPTRAERDAGIDPKPTFVGITRVADVVHFVQKRDAPLLQLADALAFGFRRYFAEKPDGEEFVRAILGKDLVREDWAGGISQFTFHQEHKQGPVLQAAETDTPLVRSNSKNHAAYCLSVFERSLMGTMQLFAGAVATFLHQHTTCPVSERMHPADVLKVLGEHRDASVGAPWGELAYRAGGQPVIDVYIGNLYLTGLVAPILKRHSHVPWSSITAYS